MGTFTTTRIPMCIRMRMARRTRMCVVMPMRVRRAVGMRVLMRVGVRVLVVIVIVHRAHALDRRLAFAAAAGHTHDSTSISLIFNSVPATMRRRGSRHTGQRPSGMVISGSAPQAEQ